MFHVLCATANDLIQQQVNQSLTVAREIVDNSNGINLASSKISWKATNQNTKQTADVSLPKMMVGNLWLGQNRKIEDETPVVDLVKKLCGAKCTVFQRMNEQGDMLRVATNIETADHARAIGTYIPAANADGSPSPVIASILKGETYRGRAYVVDAWYITAYEPIKDRSGKVIGFTVCRSETRSCSHFTQSHNGN